MQISIVCVARLSRSNGSDDNQTWNHLEYRIHPQFRMQFQYRQSCHSQEEFHAALGKLRPIEGGIVRPQRLFRVDYSASIDSFYRRVTH